MQRQLQLKLGLPDGLSFIGFHIAAARRANDLEGLQAMSQHHSLPTMVLQEKHTSTCVNSLE